MRSYHKQSAKKKDGPKIEGQVNLVPNEDHKNVCGGVVWRQRRGEMPS